MRAVLRPTALSVIGVMLAALLFGCGKSAPPGPAPVRGAVTFQGRPVPNGMVVFTPDTDRGTAGKPVRADTGPDGTFRLGAGLPPGWYRVSLVAAPGPTRFPPQLARPDTSNLLREVVAGKEHVFEFAVEVPNG